MRAKPTDILFNWHHRFEDFTIPSATFYERVEAKLAEENAEKVKVERVQISEGGFLSADREYLQVRRGEHVFHVCAAPFGKGFFVSWWLGYVDSSFFAWLARIPVIGFFARRFLKPITYYRIDTANMFQSLVASCVERVLHEVSVAKGQRALTPEECKPTTVRDLLGALART